MATHTALVIVELALDDVAEISAVIQHMNPPEIPMFAGNVRIAVGDTATEMITWLDSPEDLTSERI
ncbi:MAG TPA: hypothetical protein VHU81_06440 [Thermoanaerobaculia bacterium]|jgi:coproporphyrinogen III oxidase|nr:hypothetical protein [Thermoanaerobaculia bacterium]